MTVESDIVAVLEERAPRLPIDIAATLPDRNKGSVMTTIAVMVRRGALTKLADGRVRIAEENGEPKATSENPKPWRAPSLAPFQRVKQYLEVCGPKSKHAVMAMLVDCGVASPKNVLNDMMRDGTIHPDEQDILQFGPNPRAPSKAVNNSRPWHNNVPTRDTPKPPKYPSDASEAQRTPEATGTSKKPEAVATPTPVADEHDAGAQTLESPPSAIGPAGASDQVPPIPAENRERMRELARDELADVVDAHTLLEEPADAAGDIHITVRLPNGLTVDVRGRRADVTRAVTAIDFEALGV